MQGMKGETKYISPEEDLAWEEGGQGCRWQRAYPRKRGRLSVVGDPRGWSRWQWVDAKGSRTWVQISPLGGVSSLSREVCKQAEAAPPARTPAWDEHSRQH